MLRRIKRAHVGLALDVGGFGALSTAAAMLHPAAGAAAAGLSCLALSWLLVAG